MAMSEEARKMIQDSIAIVREDRFERFVRGRMAKDEDAGKPKPNDPPKPPPNKPPEPPAPGPKSLWWGEVFSGSES